MDAWSGLLGVTGAALAYIYDMQVTIVFNEKHFETFSIHTRHAGHGNFNVMVNLYIGV